MRERQPREPDMDRLRQQDMVVGRSPSQAADKQPRAAEPEEAPQLELELEPALAGLRFASMAATRSKAKRLLLDRNMPIPAKHRLESHIAADSNR